MKIDRYVSPTELILKNQIIMNDIRQKNHELFEKTDKTNKFMIITYGCQMNEHDSEKLIGMLKLMGYERTEVKEDADLIIFNTCCVRENAELRVYGNLGHLKSLKEKNPNLKIAVCGCMMQQAQVVEEIKKKYRHVDLIFGTHNTHNFPSLLSKAFGTKNTVVEVWDNEGEIIEGLPLERKFGLKAYVNIMYGCNNFCTYCIVPYTRGRERSRKTEDIINEIEGLVNDGIKDVTLLGQNVNSYGKTLENKISFSDLLREVNKIEGIERIKFMTSHPKDISKELIDTMAECEHVCEHLHLPIQAGSNRLLKAMNRNYTVEKYMEMINYAKERIKGLSISTDFIIGFPGETDEDIEDTIKLIKEVRYDSAFTYIYSKRQGTPAYTYENQIDEKLKHVRFEKVLDELNKIIIEKNANRKGEILEVLVEEKSKSEDKLLTGRSRMNNGVHFEGSDELIGKFVLVKITNPKKFSLVGELVEVLDK
ncbi:tRNA (N6-isopentenyl adenosine(37)-C2)-methylthiotransferase MiaB [Helicovermis profundi]|uniref:tRNA-2-methylthio-N(6)-dimethylallyladenosine synthase n=1 Tax=Helicovermis profundi TaxID=3065157 RepID=A0AAU9ELX6_9FIRM|nr:tRNA (N6-isopentenyl adenosine(37)-C2)-methylthiotransferase MiaB [Clostridia bacterium S502]